MFPNLPISLFSTHLAVEYPLGIQYHCAMTQPVALVIEDDPSLSMIFTRALSEAGFATTSAMDGRIALEALQTTTPAVVILDLHLPHVSGEELLQHIRTAEHLTQTQVVIVSADALLAGWLHEQADFALTKPISYHQLRTLATRLRQTLD